MNLSETLAWLAGQPLLALAMIGIFVIVTGGMLRRTLPMSGKLLQGLGNLALLAAFLLTIAQVTRLTTGTDLSLPQFGMPTQTVEGGETHIAMSNDGHFWLEAQVNGVHQRFLIDTGATLTAISPATAIAARIPQKSLRQTVNMRTANGSVRAELATIEDLRFGNIVARDLDAVVAPGLEDVNVIGMNFLSRLARWRVEGRTLILVPKDPQDLPET